MTKKKYIQLGNTSFCYTPLPFPFLIFLATFFFLFLLYLFFTLPKTSPVSYHQSIVLHKPLPQTLPTEDFCLTLPVLLYHHVQPLPEATKEGHAALTLDTALFETQAKYLVDEGYLTLSLQELVDALVAKEQLPEKSIALTFDDGYADWYTYLFPLLKKYQIHANLLIPTGLVGTPGYLTWGQLQEMEKSPFVTVYNHTWSHRPLNDVSKEVIDLEMKTSQKEFEKYLGKTPSIFSYPYGAYSAKTAARISFLGFQAAFTTTHGRTHCLSSLMSLPREHVGNHPLSFYGL